MNSTGRPKYVGTVFLFVFFAGFLPCLLSAQDMSGKNFRDKDFGFHIDIGYVYIENLDRAYYGGFGYNSVGLRFLHADDDHWQLEEYGSMRFPLRFLVFSLVPGFHPGLGIKKVPPVNSSDWGVRLGLSANFALELTSSLIPGLYISAAYQFNWYFRDSLDIGGDTHLVIFAAGYRFKKKIFAIE